MTKFQTFEDFYGPHYHSPLALNWENGFNHRLILPKFSKREFDALDDQWGHLHTSLPFGSMLPKQIQELTLRPITIHEAQGLHLLEVVWVWPAGGSERVHAARFINILILRPPGPFQRDNLAKSTPLLYWLDSENPDHHPILDFFDRHAPDGTSDNIQIHEHLPKGLFDGLGTADLLTEEQMLVHGLDRFAWESYAFSISSEDPKKPRLTVKERQQNFIREIALDAMARTYFSARARIKFAREQLEMLDQEHHLLETLSPRPHREKTAHDHIPAIDRTSPQSEGPQASVVAIQRNQIPPKPRTASQRRVSDEG